MTPIPIPDSLPSVTHKFVVGEAEGYLTVSLHDGKPVALNIRIARLGSTISGLMDAIAVLATMLLQSGTPIKLLSERLAGAKFEPMGYSQNPAIGYAHSLTDYVFRWLEMKFPEEVKQQEAA